ncbi:glycosyl transferase [Camelimonas fluminis]|uniref:Glycosyltransferase family 4 protein n=1 Tax=Camelimonas fluminis TaxID=1576911 RepID=A0ABV7UN40_9HYPH|nr:glycosyltransferase family 4 protein [Camelimonas fluminis]GHE79853.1 glycosyl transferase [Camelimonas fluminis]
MKVVISINTSWNIINFRAGLIGALQKQGFDVVAVAPTDPYSPGLAHLGCRHVPLPMDNMGTSPVRDLALFARYLSVLRKEKPDLYLGWTIKPNIYGSLAAHVLGIPAINNVSGLGTAFLHQGWLTRLVRMLYRLAFSRSRTVFFQNTDDCRLFVETGLIRQEQAGILPGSGVNVSSFVQQQPVQRDEGQGPVFLLVARLLWDKGIGEFVEAARCVRQLVPNARFQLLGFLDVENRTAVPRTTVEEWQREGIIEYLGHTDDVRPFIAESDCVVLPSYREGAPRSLLEAAAMGRPLITTDTTGCRDVVEHGFNGWLCQVKDAGDLAEQMLAFARLPPEGKHRMGQNSRLLAERKFDESFVIKSYTDAIQQIKSSANPGIIN